MVVSERHIRVCIPHYFRGDDGDLRYGSGQPGSQLTRSLALGRCLGALLDFQKCRRDVQLAVGNRTFEAFQSQTENDTARSVSLEIHVCGDGHHQLDAVLHQFKEHIHYHRIQLKDPRQLALAARDLLIGHPQPADLNLYLEDDLVIGDRDYFEKMIWFLNQCDHHMVLMPHRYERLDQDEIGVLLVDGPLRSEFIGQFTTPRRHVMQARWRQSSRIQFDVTSNPHSGSFCLSRRQVERLRGKALPRHGFIGPMETAATLTVLAHFPVLKPALEQWRFLAVEHGHPSFRELWQTTHKSADQASDPKARKQSRIQFFNT
ncbi:MAG: hypothetical protein WCQ20_15270 [Synechococcaceae cyanobacterium ELA739]